MTEREAKRLKTLSVLTAAAVTTVYSAVRGKGIFNAPRFKRQHTAIGRYVETHYPGGFYDPIQAADFGWMTTIRTPNRQRILLLVTETKDGVFIFKEKLT